LKTNIATSVTQKIPNASNAQAAPFAPLALKIGNLQVAFAYPAANGYLTVTLVIHLSIPVPPARKATMTPLQASASFAPFSIQTVPNATTLVSVLPAPVDSLLTRKVSAIHV
jgi:hypothetical protein